jgi:hypothetical protein
MVTSTKFVQRKVYKNINVNFLFKFRFMALSKLFLLGDKRVDNLLVIGFNPSHTNISNDVNAPLKILATLIRCLDNEKGFERGNQ